MILFHKLSHKYNKIILIIPLIPAIANFCICLKGSGALADFNNDFLFTKYNNILFLYTSAKFYPTHPRIILFVYIVNY